MDAHNFQNLITIYHERLYKQWLIVTSCMLFITLFAIIVLSSIELISYTASKKEYESLQIEVTTLKNTLSSGRKLMKRNKLLKKQRALFIVSQHADSLTALSKAIPSSTYLVSFVIDTSLHLKGCAPDMHELTLFTSNLVANRFAQVAVEKSSLEYGALGFEITAQQASS
jgi:hypothetical protein